MNTCPICHDSINDYDEYYTQCNHCFHYNCFQKWKDSELGTTCPMCRATIPKMSNHQLQQISDELKEHIESAHFLLEIFLENTQQRQKFKHNAFKSIIKALNYSTLCNASQDQFSRISDLTNQLDSIIRCF